MINTLHTRKTNFCPFQGIAWNQINRNNNIWFLIIAASFIESVERGILRKHFRIDLTTSKHLLLKVFSLLIKKVQKSTKKLMIPEDVCKIIWAIKFCLFNSCNFASLSWHDDGSEGENYMTITYMSTCSKRSNHVSFNFFLSFLLFNSRLNRVCVWTHVQDIAAMQFIHFLYQERAMFILLQQKINVSLAIDY